MVVKENKLLKIVQIFGGKWWQSRSVVFIIILTLLSMLFWRTAVRCVVKSDLCHLQGLCWLLRCWTGLLIAFNEHAVCRVLELDLIITYGNCVGCYVSKRGFVSTWLCWLLWMTRLIDSGGQNNTDLQICASAKHDQGLTIVDKHAHVKHNPKSLL